uniref:gamma-glutamylcyclotransferase n=1 Tax=Heterosigma akashiwo TaxID=2829 RepID=A0A7S4D514_HETAK|mmetsp:Transcript_27011/g.46491  ORF Transcript_27011/g.46491 Transcript_27011/m.46491 type:complete len:289 (-) Transcript_27011:392-1258(-)
MDRLFCLLTLLVGFLILAAHTDAFVTERSKGLRRSWTLKQLQNKVHMMNSAVPDKQATTVNYFAYGSNMSPGVLQGLRGIQPLSQTPAVLYGYRLRFNLPGMPGLDPSFASIEPVTKKRGMGGKLPAAATDYGLSEVHGLVFELRQQDFRHVCRTEGVPYAYSVRSVVLDTYTPHHRCPEEGEDKTRDHNHHKPISPSPGQRPATLQAQTLVSPPLAALRTPLGRDVAPSPSYLQIMREAARAGGLDPRWQRHLGGLRASPWALGGGLAGPAARLGELRVEAQRRRRQ